MLDSGNQAPDFSLPGTAPDSDDDIVEYSLSATLTQRPAVLNFYLFDFHPECRQNVCDLHDLSWFDLDTDVSVYGISTDSAYSHQEFAAQESLEYPLLSDSDSRVAETYGVLADELAGHRHVARRSVFVIDQQRKVRYAWAADSPARQPDWDAVKDAVDRLKIKS